MSMATTILPVSEPHPLLLEGTASLPADRPLSHKQRRSEVDRATAEVVARAKHLGWMVTSDHGYSKGASRYIDMELPSGLAITLRVADHAPGRALGLPGDKPCLLVIVGIPGGLSNAKRWLKDMTRNCPRAYHAHTTLNITDQGAA